ncbi:MAG: FAD-binding protein [Archangiaceae bacterium]|nr:FAD-binding protein [Archangiaceae bacterium]
MSHLAFREAALELEHDYVVVGSGAGGAAAAVTLARRRQRVHRRGRRVA